MCMVSVVTAKWDTYIPKIVPNPWDTITVSSTSNVPSDKVELSRDELKLLLDAFHKSVEAARVLDRLTNQPDCLDPEKASLFERVERLEKELGLDKLPQV